MKFTLACVALLAVVAVAVAEFPSEKEIEKVIHMYEQTQFDMDASACADLFAEDGRASVPLGASNNTGKDAIEKFYSGFFASTAYVHEFVDPFSLAIIPPYASMTKQFNAALIGNEDCPILVTVNQWFYFNNETEIESFTAMWDLGQFTHQANCHNNGSFELPEFWQDVVRQHEIAAADSPTAEQIAKLIHDYEVTQREMDAKATAELFSEHALAFIPLGGGTPAVGNAQVEYAYSTFMGQVEYIQELVNAETVAIIPPFAMMSKTLEVTAKSAPDCPVVVNVNQFVTVSTTDDDEGVEIDLFAGMWNLGSFYKQVGCNSTTTAH